MVWPFKSGEDAASFEKTLSALSGKITRASARNDLLRQRSRRVRVMWTLYAGFAYILAALLLTLVTGWRNWGAVEVSVVAGGPVLIYLIRMSLTTYYDYRISSTQAYLEKLNKERDATIDRLKAATKYNSTQQLLEKYGNSPKSQNSPPSASRRKSQGPQKQGPPPGPRTGMAPPPTANIQRPGGSAPTTPQRPASAADSSLNPNGPPLLPPSGPPNEEFAPNAFAPSELTRQYSSTPATSFTQGHWYDRILDALLGEDETQPKNRIALICSECRLVNGQAPPGVRALEDLGRWRCGGCGAWNGKEKVKEDVVTQLTKGWEEERKAHEKGLTAGANDSEEEDGALTPSEEMSPDIKEESPDEAPPPASSTRSKSKAKGKGKK